MTNAIKVKRSRANDFVSNFAGSFPVNHIAPATLLPSPHGN
jgi:hypothetical protein